MEEPSAGKDKLETQLPKHFHILIKNNEEQKYVEKLLGILRSDYEHAQELIKVNLDLLSRKPDCGN